MIELARRSSRVTLIINRDHAEAGEGLVSAANYCVWPESFARLELAMNRAVRGYSPTDLRDSRGRYRRGYCPGVVRPACGKPCKVISTK